MSTNTNVLHEYAEGRIQHLNRGQCPDIVSGHDSRDPDCPVCAALTTAAAVPPAGWVMVPVKPTEEMKAAAVKYANGPAVYKNVRAEVLRIEEGIYGEAYEAMLAAAPKAEPVPYSLDADHQGIRALCADAITGALAFGAQGINPPPEDHWLTPFWKSANADRAMRAQAAPAAVAPPRAQEAEAVAEVTHSKPDNYSSNHRIRWLSKETFPVGTKLYTNSTQVPAAVAGPSDAEIDEFIDLHCWDANGRRAIVRHAIAHWGRRANHPGAHQPADEDEGMTREQWIEQAMRVYLIAGDAEDDARECAKALCGEQNWDPLQDDLADPYDAAMSDVEDRGPAPQPAVQQGDALLSLAEKHGRVLIERCRVGGITGPLRWGIEYGYDDEIASGSTLLAAIDAARSQAKEGA